MTIQRQYNRYQQAGFVGDLSRVNAPYEFDTGFAGNGANGLQPGQGVLYDSATNRFREPANAAERLLVTGIVSYDQGVVQSTLSTTPSGSNSDQTVTYADGAAIKVLVRGTVFVTLGETLEYGDRVVYNETTNRWVEAPADNADATANPRMSATVVTGGANGSIGEVRINGYR